MKPARYVVEVKLAPDPLRETLVAVAPIVAAAAQWRDKPSEASALALAAAVDAWRNAPAPEEGGAL